jgi:4-amino-4-deoxy-L-arabinose transferase-like glycosyltransferase
VSVSEGRAAPAGAAAAELAWTAVRGPRLGAIVVGVVAVATRWPVLTSRVNPFGLQPDTKGYLHQAHDLLHGGLFPVDWPRVPGYPVFAFLVGWIPGPLENDLAVAQHALGAILAIATFLVGWRWLDRVTAWLAGLLVAAAPVLYAAEDEALPDVLLGALIFAFAVLLAATALQDAPQVRVRRALALGALAGAAILVKPVAQSLIVAVPFALLAARRPPAAIARTTLLAGLAALVVVSPWLVHNWRTFGQPSLSDQLGDTLFSRVFEVDGRDVPRIGPAGWIAAQEQQRLRVAPTGERLHAVVAGRLQRESHQTPVQVQRTMRHLAVDGIRRYPADYAWRTVKGGERYFDEARLPSSWTTALEPRVDGHGLAFAHATWWSFDRVTPLWSTLTLGGLSAALGLLLGPRRRRVFLASLLAVWAVQVLTTVATHGGLPRYSAQLVPLTFLLTIAGTTVTVRAILAGAAATRRP